MRNDRWTSGWRRCGNAVWLSLTGARPRLKLTVSVEKGAEDFWNERPDVHRLAMNVRVTMGVAFEAGVEVASEHDAQLNGAEWFADACEFQFEPPSRGV